MSDVKDRWRCENCGADSSGKFCTKCGASRPKSEKWDCSCGRLGNTGKFCSKCGNLRNCENTSETGVNSEVGGKRIAIAGHGIDSLKNNAKKGNIGISACTPKAFGNRQKGFIAVVIFLIAAYFSFGIITEKIYTAQCDKYIGLSAEIVDTYKSIGKLKGDLEADETKTIVKQLKDEEQRLDSIHSFLDKLPTPKEEKQKHNKLMAVMLAQQKNLARSAELISSKDRYFGNWGTKIPYVRDENEKSFESLVEEYGESLKDLAEILKENSELKLNHEEISKLIAWDKSAEAIKSFIANKIKFDLAWYKEKEKEYKAKLTKTNSELAQKKELVFLVSKVEKAYSSADKRDVVMITGRFYNGTDDYVTGIGDMTVDVKLNALDKEVMSISDVAYHDNRLSRVSLSKHGRSENIVIRLKDVPSDIPNGIYDNFEVKIHKIHWSVRKAVRR